MLLIGAGGTDEFWYMPGNGTLGIIGEVEGENEKPCWKFPFEFMMGSFSMKVSRLKGTLGLPGCWAKPAG